MMGGNTSDAKALAYRGGMRDVAGLCASRLEAAAAHGDSAIKESSSRNGLSNGLVRT